jgi:hypothetical protein
MSPSMKELLTEEVHRLPSAPVPVDAVIKDGRRRLRRHRAGGATVAAVAVGALAVAAPLVGWPTNSADGGPAIGQVDRTVATYSIGSTIQYGDQAIDVSPHQVWSFVRTDDGFVFCTESGEVYFADGATVEKIGDGNDWQTLAADDTGSYVGWVDFGSERPEFVFYDTSSRAEVLRTSEGNVTGPAAFDGPEGARMGDIDGDTAFVHDAEGVTAWNLTDGTSEQIAPGVLSGWLWAVADGRIAHVQEGGPGLDHLVVSDDPAADQPRLPFGWDPPGVKLSPTGKHVVTIAPVTADIAVTELPSGRDVAPDDSQYSDGLIPLQWVGDDVLYAAGTPRGDDAADVVRCTIPTGTCRVVVEAVGPAEQIQAPSGQNSPMGMNIVIEKMAHSTP